MRIVMTLPSLAREFGGPVTKAHHLRKALEELGHQVDLVGSGESEGAIGLGTVGRFHTTPVPRHLKPIRSLVRQADVVHILGYRDPVGTIAAFWADRYQVPFLLEPTGMYAIRIRSFRVKRLFEVTIGRRLLARCAGAIATSRLEAEEFDGTSIEGNRVFVRPNGVALDPPNETLGTWRRKLGIPIDAKLVVALGRITVKKTLTDLVRAVDDLPDVWVLIVGPAEQDGALEALHRELHRSPSKDRVVVHPVGVWGADKASLLMEADCFCLPSLYENFGNAAAEAVLAGLPVVLSNRCGVSEFLPEELVEIVPFGEVADLSAALTRALAIPAVTREKAVEKTKQTLGWSHVAGMQVDIYGQAAGG